MLKFPNNQLVGYIQNMYVPDSLNSMKNSRRVLLFIDGNCATEYHFLESKHQQP